MQEAQRKWEAVCSRNTSQTIDETPGYRQKERACHRPNHELNARNDVIVDSLIREGINGAEVYVQLPLVVAFRWRLLGSRSWQQRQGHRVDPYHYGRVLGNSLAAGAGIGVAWFVGGTGKHSRFG